MSRHFEFARKLPATKDSADHQKIQKSENREKDLRNHSRNHKSSLQFEFNIKDKIRTLRKKMEYPFLSIKYTDATKPFYTIIRRNEIAI